AGQTTAAEATGRHVEVTAVLLDHDVRGHFGGAEEGMFGLVDGESLGDAVFVLRVVVVPAGVQFAKGNRVGQIAVDFVGGHVNEGRFRAGAARRFEQVQGSACIGIEIVERGGGCAIMRRLRGGVDNGIRLYVGHQAENRFAVADVDGIVLVAANLAA